MWENGILKPLPIKQTLQPIFDIFKKPVIANIEHPNGEKVNQTRILSAALNGYAKYCRAYGCDMSSCAATVKLGNTLYHEQDFNIEGRKTFMEENGENYIFFSNGWNLAPDFGKSPPLLKTSKCPQRSVDFEGIQTSLPPLPNFEKWLDCSGECLKRSSCQFWKYSSSSKKCTLIEDYERTKSASDDVFTGSKDCPGEKSKYNSAFGMCVENMESRSMWSRFEEEAFDKDMKIEAFDPSSFMVAGGFGGSLSK